MGILRGKKKKKEVKYLKKPSGSLEDVSLKLPWSRVRQLWAPRCVVALWQLMHADTVTAAPTQLCLSLCANTNTAFPDPAILGMSEPPKKK